MKIAVFGATGGTGKRVVEQALASGHEVIAVARRPEAITARHDKLRVSMGDVVDGASVAAAIEGAEAVISTFGPPDNGAPGKLMSTGVANIVAACEQKDVRRFVFESGLMCSDGAGLSFASRVGVRLFGWWYSALRDDKRIAERSIAESKIPHWVIVRPPSLSDAPGTGKYVQGVGAPVDATRPMPHADVAAFLIRAATEDEYAKTVRSIGAA
jgi:uncharacterized protein YbjT (DUF2867 family)